MGIRLANMALALLVTILLARLMGPQSYGQYAFVYAIIVLLAAPVKMGLPQLLIRETAILAKTGDVTRMRAIWGLSNTLVAGASVLISVGVLIWLTQFGGGVADEKTYWIALLYLPLAALGILRGAALRGLGWITLGQLPELVLRPAFFVVILLLLAVSGRVFDATEAMAWHVGAAGLAALIGVFSLWRVAPERPENPAPLDPPLNARALLASTAFLGFASGLAVLNNSVDVLMIGAFRTAEDVGLYRPLATLAAFTLFGQQVMMIVLQPRAAAAYAAGEPSVVQRLASQLALVASAVAIIAILITWSAGGFLLKVMLGEPYAAVAAVLTLMVIGYGISAPLGAPTMMLNMIGQERLSFVGTLGGLVLNVILNALLIGPYGIWGAAFATVASAFVAKLVLAIMLRKILGRPTTLVGL